MAVRVAAQRSLVNGSTAEDLGAATEDLSLEMEHLGVKTEALSETMSYNGAFRTARGKALG